MSIQFWSDLSNAQIAYAYGTVQYETGDTMSEDKKQWSVAGIKFDTREKAEKAAKKMADQYKRDQVIWEAVAVATFPVPNIEIKELAAS